MKEAYFFRVGGAAPPAASRCSARASLRTPSRGDPPLKDLRACGFASGYRGIRMGRRRFGTRERPIAQVSTLSNVRSRKKNRAKRDLMRGWGREGVRSEARAKQRLA